MPSISAEMPTYFVRKKCEGPNGSLSTQYPLRKHWPVEELHPIHSLRLRTVTKRVAWMPNEIYDDLVFVVEEKHSAIGWRNVLQILIADSYPAILQLSLLIPKSRLLTRADALLFFLGALLLRRFSLHSVSKRSISVVPHWSYPFPLG
jgi:hypothetical protein